LGIDNVGTMWYNVLKMRKDRVDKEREMSKKQTINKLERERDTLREMQAKLEAGEYTTRTGKPISRRMLEGAIRSKKRGINMLEKRAGLV